MILFSLLLPACPSLPVPGSCEALEAPPVVACYGADVDERAEDGSLAVTFSGVVRAVTRDGRPAVCQLDVGNRGLDAGLVVEIEDEAGATRILAFDVPGLADDFVKAGDTVQASVSYAFGGFGPDEGFVALAPVPGDPVVLVATAGSLDALPPSFTLTEGEQRCTEDDGCGVWSKYDLAVAVGDEDVPVGYGESVDLDGATFVHGGYERQAEDQAGVCPDWFVAHVTYAVIVD